jgi:hypothetical protein
MVSNLVVREKGGVKMVKYMLSALVVGMLTVPTLSKTSADRPVQSEISRKPCPICTPAWCPPGCPR